MVKIRQSNKHLATEKHVNEIPIPICNIDVYNILESIHLHKILTCHLISLNLAKKAASSKLHVSYEVIIVK